MAIASDATLDPVRFVDGRKLGRYQVLIILICVLISLADGLDSQILSVAIPAVRRDLHLEISQLGQILSASQLGAFLGALSFGLVADKWGRRPSVIVSSLLFSVGTVLTAHATSFVSLTWLRFLTGVGIGGAIPSYVALAAEYTPTRMRAFVTAIVVSGVPAGGVLTGLVGAVWAGGSAGALLDWRQIFLLCGAFSGLVCLGTMVILPESLGFLLVRRKDAQKLARVLRRIAPDDTKIRSGAFTITRPDAPTHASLLSLFAPDYRWFTVIFGLMFLLTYAALIGQLVWTPTLLERGGMAPSQASLALGYHNFGAIVGNLIAGLLVDRFRAASSVVVSSFFVGAAFAIALVGLAVPNMLAVGFFSTLSGVLIAACSASLYAMAVLKYPTESRSTGIGWGSALSRIGAVVGPLSVGSLAAAHWAVAAIFLCLGLAVLANAILVAMASIVTRGNKGVAGLTEGA